MFPLPHHFVPGEDIHVGVDPASWNKFVDHILLADRHQTYVSDLLLGFLLLKNVQLKPSLSNISFDDIKSYARKSISHSKNFYSFKVAIEISLIY